VDVGVDLQTAGEVAVAARHRVRGTRTLGIERPRVGEHAHVLGQLTTE